MLRGAQTPGELKQRTERLHPMADLGAVLDALERLIGRELAVRLSRRPGQKEERYAQLLGEDAADGEAPAAVRAGAPSAPAPAAATPRPRRDGPAPVAPPAAPPAPAAPDPRVAGSRRRSPRCAPTSGRCAPRSTRCARSSGPKAPVFTPPRVTLVAEHVGSLVP